MVFEIFKCGIHTLKCKLLCTSKISATELLRSWLSTIELEQFSFMQLTMPYVAEYALCLNLTNLPINKESTQFL